MFSLSVVLPVLRDELPPRSEIERIRQGLEATGKFSSIELVLAAGAGDANGYDGEGIRWIRVSERGMVSLAHAGLKEASGELAVILDPRHGYGLESILRVLDPVIRGDAEVAVAYPLRRRRISGPHSPVEAVGRRTGEVGRVGGLILRPMLGTAAPFSGLIGLQRAAVHAALSTIEARADKPSAGSFFVLDLVSRLPEKPVDVPVDRDGRVRMRPPGLNDVRQVKSLLDERFGNYSRLAQFCLVGASGMIIDLSFYAFFQWLFARAWPFASDGSWLGDSARLATAGGLSIFLALIWNFMLNRRLTFNDAMAGNIFRQFLAYALGNALGVVLSFSLRLYLPSKFSFFEQHKLAAAVVGIVAATGISFSMSRWVVFSNRPPSGSSELPDVSPAP